jgi:GNAT superfamily N-acetyltransferase
MSDSATVRQAVFAALQRVAPELSPAELDPTAPLRDQVDLDSMDWLNFLVALRENFGVDIPETDYARLATLDSLLAYLRQRHARAPPSPHGFPAERHLVDGRTVTIRPIREEDADRVRDFLSASSEESRYNRFQKWVRAPSDNLVHFLTHVDRDRNLALVCAAGGEIVGEARYLANPDGKSCEFGVLIEDSWRKTGIAGLLMEALIEAARERGFASMEGIVLASNATMLRFAHALGFEIEPMVGELTLMRIRLRLQPVAAAVVPQA